jgi:hypothetical protein
LTASALPAACFALCTTLLGLALLHARADVGDRGVRSLLAPGRLESCAGVSDVP